MCDTSFRITILWRKFAMCDTCFRITILLEKICNVWHLFQNNYSLGGRQWLGGSHHEIFTFKVFNYYHYHYHNHNHYHRHYHYQNHYHYYNHYHYHKQQLQQTSIIEFNFSGLCTQAPWPALPSWCTESSNNQSNHVTSHRSSWSIWLFLSMRCATFTTITTIIITIIITTKPSPPPQQQQPTISGPLVLLSTTNSTLCDHS